MAKLSRGPTSSLSYQRFHQDKTKRMSKQNESTILLTECLSHEYLLYSNPEPFLVNCNRKSQFKGIHKLLLVTHCLA